MKRGVRAAGCVLGLVALAGSASGTWSIIIINTRTGEVAAGSATCLTNFDLQANTPVLIPMVGAATAQSFVDSDGSNRTFIRDGMARGDSLSTILAGLAVRDSGHQTRQYGMAKVDGDRLTFSGTGAGGWAGGRVGRVGELVYAVQGNVLTGAPVVDEAVRAIEETPGDIAAKLMASMEAARVMGGDGRCSCNRGPEGCGSPPPSFTKSAHIAYMLIGRDGDTVNCRAMYRTDRAVGSAAVLDLNGDGKPDVAATGAGAGGGLSLMENTSADGLASLGPASGVPGGSTIRDVVTADLDGDGFGDVIASSAGSNAIAVWKGRVGGGLGAVALYPAGGSNPGTIAVGDLTGDGVADVVVSTIGTNDVWLLPGDGSGGFGAGQRLGVVTGVAGVSIGDLNGDGRADVAAVGSSTVVVGFVSDGSGGFVRQNLVTLPRAASGVFAGDLNGDGRADLVTVSANETTARLHVRRADGTYESSAVTLTGVGVSAALADLDRDGVSDLVVFGRSLLHTMRGLGGGVFDGPRAWTHGWSAGKSSLADMDGDGDLDVVSSTSSQAVLLTANLSRPGEIDFGNAGCASGSMYMELNVANQTAAAPDPVITLREMYDAWRGDLAGVADAVVSEAAFERAYTTAGGKNPARLRVVLRDLDGRAVGEGWDVRGVSAGAAGVIVGEFARDEDGSYAADVRRGSTCGQARVKVIASDGSREVVLMPAAELAVGPLADWDGDGFVDFFDYDAFMSAYEAGASSADLDGDQRVTPTDLERFVSAFDVGCG